MSENLISPVSIQVEDRIAVVTINNPPVNALSKTVLRELSHAMDRLRDDRETKAVIITGTGMFFVAGADIREIAGAGGGKKRKEGEKSSSASSGSWIKSIMKIRWIEKMLYRWGGRNAALMGQTLFNKIESMPKPVIAAINGICLGGGMELAMACHLRVASDRAQLGQPEIKLGIIPGFGATQRLPRIIGRPKALQYLLTGENIPVQEAKSMGLVNDVVPDGEVLRHARGFAKRITSMGGVAVAHILQAVREGADLSLHDGLWLEASLFGDICTTEDMKEGLKAFMEKRQPRFQDK